MRLYRLRPPIQNLTLRSEAALASLLVGLLGAASVIGLHLAVQRAEQGARWVAHTHEVIGLAQAVARDAIEAQSGFRGYLLSHDRAFLDQFAEGNGAFASDLARLTDLLEDNPAQLARAARLGELYRAWRTGSAEPLIRQPPAGELGAGEREIIRGGKARIDALRATADELVSAEQVLLTERQRESSATTRQLDLLGMFGSAFVALLGAGGAVVFARRVGRRLASVASSARAIAGGDLGHRIRGLRRRRDR
ncbi:MAG: CHASE3 domain-containing protein [Anaeromyxobacter sp.]